MMIVLIIRFLHVFSHVFNFGIWEPGIGYLSEHIDFNAKFAVMGNKDHIEAAQTITYPIKKLTLQIMY